MTRVRELAPDEVTVLEEERDFLLRSLDDLEEEHAAGDVDEHDYETLRDDYTARAAKVLRAIEANKAKQTPRPAASRDTWRRVAIGAGVVVFALGAGLLVERASGRRSTGDTLTGDIRGSTEQEMQEALVMGREGRFDQAIVLYDEVLDDQPDNVQAKTYKGWMQYLSGDVGSGLTTLIDAATADPDYPDVHAFLAVVLFRGGQPDAALRELDRLDALDPPDEILSIVQPLRDELTASTTTTAPTAPTETTVP
jgi:tetratricopeptide (TPR) repeat protein